MTTTTTRLSARYSAPACRATTRHTPRWTKITSGPRAMQCAECAQLQHETRGQSGARMRPRERRMLADLELLLCTQHAEAWRDRDREDTTR